MKTYDQLHIDGAWVAPTGHDSLDVIDSTTEEVFATIPAGVGADIDRAVAAAKAAFPAWSEAQAPERAKLLRRVAEELEARRDEIADVITHEVGMPKGQSAAIQVGPGISAFSTASELASTFAFEDTSNGLVVREPIGVVGCITPWNYPLNQIGAKVAYALAAGCTVVFEAVGGRAGQRLHPRRDHRRHPNDLYLLELLDRPRAERCSSTRSSSRRRSGRLRDHVARLRSAGESCPCPLAVTSAARSVRDVERPVDAGDLEHTSHVRGDVADDQERAFGFGFLVSSDEHRQATRIAEGEVCEVEEDLVGSGDRRHDGRFDHRTAIRVELAADTQD
jgi:hypothetical protein